MEPTALRSEERALVVTWPDGRESVYHYIWLRDNCRCHECVHPVTLERSLFTASIPPDIRPHELAWETPDTLRVVWPDGHLSRYCSAWLREYGHPPSVRAGDRPEPRLWGGELADRLPSFGHAEVVGSEAGLLRFMESFRDHGFARVRGVPAVPREVAHFAEHVAYVREIIFGRVHEVVSLADAYNVAQTGVELKPHTDLPSYHWPPSVQLIHCLENQARGGDSIVVDGFHCAAALRRERPQAFETLTRVAVPFRLYASDGDTLARAPIIQLDTEGRVCTFRFSNQLLQPLDIPAGRVEPFYDAYRALSRLVVEPRNQVRFRLERGDMMVLHGHRVMHGRAAFDPESGPRHLQDVYMEFDDFMGRIRLLRAKLRGEGGVPGEATKQASHPERARAVR